MWQHCSQGLVPPAATVPEQPFNPLNPVLKDTALDEADLVRSVARVTVEWVVPKILLGAKGKKSVMEFAEKALEMFPEAERAKMSPIVAEAFVDLCLAAKVLKALVEDLFNADDRAAFETVLWATSGPLLVMKNVSPGCCLLSC